VIDQIEHQEGPQRVRPGKGGAYRLALGNGRRGGVAGGGALSSARNGPRKNSPRARILPPNTSGHHIVGSVRMAPIGARPDGRKELSAIEDGYRESTEGWMQLTQDLIRRRMATEFGTIKEARSASRLIGAAEKWWRRLKQGKGRPPVVLQVEFMDAERYQCEDQEIAQGIAALSSPVYNAWDFLIVGKSRVSPSVRICSLQAFLAVVELRAKPATASGAGAGSQKGIQVPHRSGPQAKGTGASGR